MQTDYFSVKIEPTPKEFKKQRVFLAVSKRVIPKSTDRNKLKRRIRGALRSLKVFDQLEGRSIRVVPHSSVKNKTYKEIKIALYEKLSRFIKNNK